MLRLAPVILVFIFAQPAAAQQREVFRFLQIPSSPRQAALGSVQAALSYPDPLSVHANPAFTAELPAGTLTLAHTNLFADVSLMEALYTRACGGFNCAGSVRLMNYGDFQQIDESGTVTGDLRAYDVAFSLAAGKRIAPGWTTGVDAAFVHSAYASVRASALTGGAGVVYSDTTARFRAAAALVRGGRLLRGFDGEQFRLFRAYPDQRLPTDLRVSFSKKPQYVPLLLHATLHSLNRYPLELAGEPSQANMLLLASRHLALGAELLLSEMLVFRLGFDKFRHDQHRSDDQFDRAGVSFGVGFNTRRFAFEFSRSNYSGAGYVFQLAARAAL